MKQHKNFENLATFT